MFTLAGIATILSLIGQGEQLLAPVLPLMRGLVESQREPTPEEAAILQAHFDQLAETGVIDADWIRSIRQKSS